MHYPKEREAFEHRILPFGEVAALLYGKIMGKRKALGKPLSILDGQIAAIARANNCTVATRNSKDFADCGLNLINPFLV
jgi:predicted nucleic acid-binding protein